MPSLADLKDKLQGVKDQLPEILLEAATSVSLAGKALAERTIKDKGFGEKYSQQEIPVWFLEGKELNAAGSAYIKSKKNGKGKNKNPEADGMGNWEEFRKAQGLQTGFVDLSYSNEMWSGMFPRDAFQKGTQYIAPLAHNNKAGQEKMNWNRERYGDFVGKALTGDNTNVLGEVAVDEVYRLIIQKSNL